MKAHRATLLHRWRKLSRRSVSSTTGMTSGCPAAPPCALGLAMAGLLRGAPAATGIASPGSLCAPLDRGRRGERPCADEDGSGEVDFTSPLKIASGQCVEPILLNKDLRNVAYCEWGHIVGDGV